MSYAMWHRIIEITYQVWSILPSWKTKKFDFKIFIYKESPDFQTTLNSASHVEQEQHLTASDLCSQWCLLRFADEDNF